MIEKCPEKKIAGVPLTHGRTNTETQKECQGKKIHMVETEVSDRYMTRLVQGSHGDTQCECEAVEVQQPMLD